MGKEKFELAKPGYKTTELWLTVAALIYGQLSGSLPPWATVALIAAYNLARGLAKSGVIGGFVGKMLNEAPGT